MGGSPQRRCRSDPACSTSCRSRLSIAMRAVESSPTLTVGVATALATGVAMGVAAATTRDAGIDGVGQPGPDGIAGVAIGVPPFTPVVMAPIHLPLSFVARALNTPSPLRYSNSADVPSSRPVSYTHLRAHE